MHLPPVIRIALLAAASVMVLGPFSCGVSTITSEPVPPKDAGTLPPVDSGTPLIPKELCGNAIDDDGDGLVDEECQCSPGAARGCFSANPALIGVGVCRAGSQSCTEQGELRTEWGLCAAEVLPSTERCNGLDDNCDGTVDEALQRACSSACGAGVELCANGAYGGCSARLPAIEICNGVDDDCDGQTDESLDRACSSACGGGVEACINGAYAACNARLPALEVCNGVDDDCDGQIDEALSRACSTICGAGVEVCASGAYGSCSARTPTAEICGNQIDDDCDGLIDEDCFCIKSPGPSPWQMHLGEAPMCWGTTFPTHGDIGEYAYSTIPAETAPGWTAHAAPAISFNDPSQMCGVCSCRAGGDFTYFQTSFEVPAGFTVQSLVVTILDVDDGVRVTVFNSSYPNGAVSTGSYAYLGGGSTSNLASLITVGRNRIVLTHLDDCCAVRRIATATVSLNGTAINPCP